MTCADECTDENSPPRPSSPGKGVVAALGGGCDVSSDETGPSRPATGRVPGAARRGRPGTSLPSHDAEWRDAIVMVECGDVELECAAGGRRRFAGGAVLWLAGIDIRVLHNVGVDPVVLVAISRRRDHHARPALGSAGETSTSCWRPTARTSGTRTPRCPAAAAAAGRVGAGVRLRLADGRELVDGMSSWWAAIHGYRHPGARRRRARPARRDGHVMFGGLTHGPAVELARAARRDHPGRARARLPRRLRLGVRRGRDQDVPAVPALARAPGQAPAADLARRLPRRHLRRDERLRPGRRDARAVARRAAAAGLRRTAAGRRSTQRLRRRSSARLVEAHADELAAVIVEPVVQGAGGMRFYDPRYLRVLRELCRRARRAAGLRRDRDRLRAHGRAVRRRARRRRAGRHVRRQGADRRLPVDGRGAVHRARSRAGSPTREAGASLHARPDVHGQPARRAAVAERVRSRLLRRAAGAATCAGSRPGCAPGSRRARGAARGRRRARAGRDRRRAARPPGRRRGGDRRGRRARGVAAAVPRPRLHDAAVRVHGRRRRRRARRRGRAPPRPPVDPGHLWCACADRCPRTPSPGSTARGPQAGRRTAPRADAAGRRRARARPRRQRLPGPVPRPAGDRGRGRRRSAPGERARPARGSSPGRRRCTPRWTARSRRSAGSRPRSCSPPGTRPTSGPSTALSGAGALVVSDAANHASIVDACRLSRARVAVVPHRDVGAVDAALAGRDRGAGAGGGRERSYSVDGDDGPAARAARRVPAAAARCWWSTRRTGSACAGRGSRAARGGRARRARTTSSRP